MDALEQIRLDFDPGSLVVLNVVIASIMFGIALDLRVADFRRVLRDPQPALVGLVCQFLVLPAATYALIHVLSPAPSVALGMILVASCPGGNVSNVVTYLAGGNTALSVGMTAVSSVVATIATPLNIAFWAGLNPSTSELLRSVSLDPVALLATVALVLGLPLVLGMSVGSHWPRVSARLRGPVKTLCGISFATFIVLGLLKHRAFLQPELLPILGAVIAHNAVALGLGYWLARLSRLGRRECRTVSIEVGIQNSALGLAIIFTFFEGMVGMALTAAVWGIWHLIAGLGLALLWSREPLGVEEAETA